MTTMSPLRIVFRTDANQQIGTGHFMRCLTLADEMRRSAADICFVVRELPMHLQQMLLDRGIQYIALPKTEVTQEADELPHALWLQTSQKKDAEQTLVALGVGIWDWLVVDHYSLDHRFETTLRKVCKLVMAIDDLADRVHDCDVLLDQNYYADQAQRYLGKVPPQCRLLLGPSFALLRPEFKAKREKLQTRAGEVKNLLVFFGGVDADNLTGQILNVLINLKLGVHVSVVVGQQHPQKEKIQQLCAHNGYACHVQTSDMACLMAEADLSIGAGGSATWERCALGLPTIVIATAHHQIKAAKDLSDIGISKYLGFWSELNFEKIQQNIKKIIKDKIYLHEMSVNSLNLVDGDGAVKILSIILENHDGR